MTVLEIIGFVLKFAFQIFGIVMEGKVKQDQAVADAATKQIKFDAIAQLALDRMRAQALGLRKPDQTLQDRLDAIENSQKPAPGSVVKP